MPPSVSLGDSGPSPRSDSDLSFPVSFQTSWAIPWGLHDCMQRQLSWASSGQPPSLQASCSHLHICLGLTHQTCGYILMVLHTWLEPEAGLTHTSHFYLQNSCRHVILSPTGELQTFSFSDIYLLPQPAAGSFAMLSSRWLEADGRGHGVAFIFHLVPSTFSSTTPWEGF